MKQHEAGHDNRLFGHERPIPVEFVIEAWPHDVGAEVDALRHNSEARNHIIERVTSEIDIEIFELCCPIRGQHGSNAAPTCPTRPGGCARTEGAIGQDVALRTVQRDPGQAAGHLEHHIIQDAGPTDATVERAERLQTR
jgi:hypothetical protein